MASSMDGVVEGEVSRHDIPILALSVQPHNREMPDSREQEGRVEMGSGPQVEAHFCY